jgi:thiol-disulfide isomerase/thioredoxin
MATSARKRRGFLRTVLIALGVTLILVVALMYLQPKAPAPPPRAKETAADRAAPASLRKAADALGFKANTEAGVGSIEDKPAADAKPPVTGDLLPIGAAAPAFSLRTPTGQTVSLASLKGNVALIEFFATWCPHCVAEAPHLAALARSFHGRPVKFVAINADSENAASVFAFHRYFGLPYPALLDIGSKPGDFHHPGGLGPVSAAYKVGIYPTFYVVDRNGIIRWRGDAEQPDATLRNAINRTFG